MTTEEDEAAHRAFVELIVGLAPSIEGIVRAEPIPGELGVELELEPELRAATGADGTPTRAFLGNLFEETRSLEPDEREARARHHLASMVSAAAKVPDWDEAQSKIFLVIRSLGFFHALGGSDVLARRSLPLLAECVVLDLGEAMTYVTSGLLERWGCDTDTLFEIARTNVETQLEHDLGPEGDDDPPRIFRLTSGDSFESSRILSLDWLAKAREALGVEALVCAVPDRDTLLIAVDISPPTLVRLAQLAESLYVESPRSVSPALYLFTPSGELGPLELVDEHPLRERIRRGHLMLADAEYGAQKAALDQNLADQGVEMFIASYFAVDKDGMVFSYATWAEGVDAFLPHVDLMAFSFAGDRQPLLVPFDAVAGLAGELLQEVPDLVPIRYRTLGFPGEELLAVLATHAVDI